MLGTPADSYLRRATERLIRAASEKPDPAARDLIAALEEVVKAVEQIDARLTAVEAKSRDAATGSAAVEKAPVQAT